MQKPLPFSLPTQRVCWCPMRRKKGMKVLLALPMNPRSIFSLSSCRSFNSGFGQCNALLFFSTIVYWARATLAHSLRSVVCMQASGWGLGWPLYYLLSGPPPLIGLHSLWLQRGEIDVFWQRSVSMIDALSSYAYEQAQYVRART